MTLADTICADSELQYAALSCCKGRMDALTDFVAFCGIQAVKSNAKLINALERRDWEAAANAMLTAGADESIAEAIENG